MTDLPEEPDLALPPPTGPAVPESVLDPYALPPEGAPIPEELLAEPVGNSMGAPVVGPSVTVGPGAASTATSADGTPSDGDRSRAARRRAAEQAARHQSDLSRRRVLIAGVVVVALLAALVGAWALVGRPREGASGTAPTASPSATVVTQPTLLFQIKDAEGVAVDNALLSVGGSVSLANIITIGPSTVVDVATGGPLPFGQVARLPDADASANALSDAIGVNVDGTFSLDSLAFSALVDAVGGVVMDVDVDVLVDQPDGSQVVLVPAGKHQLLQGPQAAAYATYLAVGEPEAARMARFVTVLRLTLAKLPPDVAKVESIVTGLGASARATVPSAEVAQFLVKMREYLLADNVAYNTVPVVPLGTGDLTAYRVDAAAASVLVHKYLPDAVRKPGPNSQVRVLVQNGVGTPGLNTAARQRLVDAGFTYVNGGNASTHGLAATQIIIPDTSTTSRQWGTDIATALGVPQTAVTVATEGQSIADVIVVLGADFKPVAS